jgi:hypothetical protein
LSAARGCWCVAVLAALGAGVGGCGGSTDVDTGRISGSKAPPDAVVSSIADRRRRLESAGPDARYIARHGFAAAATAPPEVGARRELGAGRAIAPRRRLRTLGSYLGTDWWVGQGREKDRVCFVSRRRTVTIGCFPVRSEYRGGIWMYRGLSDHRQITTVVVPDGYDTARLLRGRARRRTPIRRNLMALLHAVDLALELRGPGLPPVTIEIPLVGGA